MELTHGQNNHSLPRTLQTTLMYTGSSIHKNCLVSRTNGAFAIEASSTSLLRVVSKPRAENEHSLNVYILPLKYAISYIMALV